MNYEYCKVFYYVGKHKNISKAAMELHLSQPAVSRIIHNLENELSCKLFTRNKNGVDFTSEGNALYEYVSSAVGILDKGEIEIINEQNVDYGTVYIGASATSLDEYLFSFLNTFKTKYPHVMIKIISGSNNGIVQKLNEGTIDIAFVSTPCRRSKSLTIKRVKTFEDVLVASPSYSYLKDKTLSLEQVLNYPFICLRKGMQLREFIDTELEKNGLILSPNIELDSADLLVPFIKRDFGIGFAPKSMCLDSLENGELIQLNLDYKLPSRDILMIYNPIHPISKSSHEFIRMVNGEVK